MPYESLMNDRFSWVIIGVSCSIPELISLHSFLWLQWGCRAEVLFGAFVSPGCGVGAFFSVVLGALLLR